MAVVARWLEQGRSEREYRQLRSNPESEASRVDMPVGAIERAEAVIELDIIGVEFATFGDLKEALIIRGFQIERFPETLHRPGGNIRWCLELPVQILEKGKNGQITPVFVRTLLVESRREPEATSR